MGSRQTTIELMMLSLAAINPSTRVPTLAYKKITELSKTPNTFFQDSVIAYIQINSSYLLYIYM